MKILVCGGAGYIGSHFVKSAISNGHLVSVVDNLSTGHANAISNSELLQANISDQAWLTEFLVSQSFDLIMHFCAFSLVGESMTNPALYYQNNVASTLSLLKAMRETGHKNLIFSSTAAIYGEPEMDKISESHKKFPINPYGRSKWMVEQILRDYAVAYGLNSVSLRYFNAAGADPSACIGEKHSPETHLIPNILKSVASGGDKILKVFGSDYPTPDGSCVRDYIHVSDLASAHLLAGEYLISNPGAHAFNLGIGNGFSLSEVIDAASRIIGEKIKFQFCGRRPGDPPVLVADSSLAQVELNWQPEYTGIEAIIETAWRWHKNGEVFKSY
jgi:UDP-glucose 4-epimerase